jgi:hypothetical protein
VVCGADTDAVDDALEDAAEAAADATVGRRGWGRTTEVMAAPA